MGQETELGTFFMEGKNYLPLEDAQQRLQELGIIVIALGTSSDSAELPMELRVRLPDDIVYEEGEKASAESDLQTNEFKRNNEVVMREEVTLVKGKAVMRHVYLPTKAA